METTRAGIAIYKINYQSDFTLTVVCDVEWGTPFCIKFWTGEPAQAYYVGWDGKEYRNCKVVESDPSKLLVLFDDHHLPVGELNMQIVYHATIEDFPNAIVDEVTNSMKVMAFIDGKNQKVALDFEGEEAAELQFELPAYANEAQRIANEEQRIANEQSRIEAEQQRIDNEQTRQDNEAQRITQETARVNEYAGLKADAVAATDAANDAATLANQKAQLAADKAALADAAATLANQKAQIAAYKAALADAAATLANQKAEYADAQGDYAKEQGDYAKEQGDTALADHRRAESDHETAASDHTIAANDHTQAGNDHTRAESDHSTAADDHTLAASDHSTAAADHTLAASDHSTAAADHTLAASDHSTAANDHTQAGNDHTRAESDHTRAESDHAAVEVYVDSLGAFDISSYHATGGVLAKYADLTAALGTGGANIPEAIRKGGMSVKFVHTSDNKYVQYFLTKNQWSASEADWQKVNLEKEVIQLSQEVIDLNDAVFGGTKFSYAQVESGGTMTFNPITLNQDGDALIIRTEFSDSLSSNQSFAFTRYNGGIAVSLNSAKIGIKDSSGNWVSDFNASTGEYSLNDVIVNTGVPIKLAYESGKMNLYVGNTLIKTLDSQPDIKIDTLCGEHNSNYWVGKIFEFSYLHNGIKTDLVSLPGFYKNSGVTLVYSDLESLPDRMDEAEEKISELDGEIPDKEDILSSIILTNGYYNPSSGTFTQQASGSYRLSVVNYIKGSCVITPISNSWRVYRVVGYNKNCEKIFVSVNDAYAAGEIVTLNEPNCAYYRFTMEDVSYQPATSSTPCIESLMQYDGVVSQNKKEIGDISNKVEKDWKDTLVLALGEYHPGTGAWTPGSGRYLSCVNFIPGGITIFPKNNNWRVRSIIGYDSNKRIISMFSDFSNLGMGEAVKNSGAYFYRFTLERAEGSASITDDFVESVISESAIDGIERIEKRLDQNIDGGDCQQLDFKFELGLVSPNYSRITYPANVSELYDEWEALRLAHIDYITKSSAADDYGETPAVLPAPIYLYKFLAKKNRIDSSRHVKVLIYSGEHPNERASLTTTLEVMRAITEDWGLSHDLALLRSMVDIYVIPCLSPWGYDNNSRVNSNGVNINRNAATINWMAGNIGENYGGTSPASEYETQVLQYYINSIKPDITIDVHAGGTNSYGVICTVDAFINDEDYNAQPGVDLVTTITKTGSNRFIIDDDNYPQELNTNLIDANIQYESIMKTITQVDNYHGETGNYALEHGVRLPVLIELCADSSWLDGVYSGSFNRWDAKVSRGDVRHMANVLMRLVKYYSQVI